MVRAKRFRIEEGEQGCVRRVEDHSREGVSSQRMEHTLARYTLHQLHPQRWATPLKIPYVRVLTFTYLVYVAKPLL